MEREREFGVASTPKESHPTHEAQARDDFRGVHRLTPSGALEEQNALAKMWLTKDGLGFFNEWREVRTRDGYSNVELTTEERIDHEVRGLLGARTYFVSEDMRLLAEHAALSRPDEPIIETDLPCPSGCMFFERPMLVPDIHGKLIAIGMIRWQAVNYKRTGAGDRGRGVMWVAYGDVKDPRSHYCTPWARWATRLIIDYEDAEQMDTMPLTAEEAAEHHGAKVEDVRGSIFFLRKVPLTLWTLFGQTLSTITEEYADRPARRRLAKENSLLTLSKIRVVRLRRESGESEHGAPGSVEWSHRWLVSGHWRNQWLPSIKAHRLQWIRPFVKGPSDKPFVPQRTVHVLER